MSLRIILLFSIIIGAQSSPVPHLEACKSDDFKCQIKNANTLFAIGVVGNPDLNIEGLDPLYLDKIVGDLGEVKYELRNSTFEGFKDCILGSPNLDVEKLKIVVNLHCTYLYMYGQYQISGKLLSMPVEGDGDYTLKIKDYDMNVIIDIKLNPGKDGQVRMSFETFTVTGDLQGQQIFNATNLFNGHKDMADNLLNFVNQNGKTVFTVLQEPVLKVIIKKINTNINKLLEEVPVVLVP